jgi:hypothetical protein
MMTRQLHALVFSCLLATGASTAVAQSELIAGDPVAFGNMGQTYNLLAELTEAAEQPKILRNEKLLDLEIKTSKMHIDLSKDKQVEFSARSEWATNFVWKFGDGSILSGFQHVKHEFKHPGTYLVTLIASNNEEVAKKTLEVTVVNPNAALELEEMAHFVVFPADNKLEVDFQLNMPRREKHLILEMQDISGSSVYQFEIGKVRKKELIHVDLRNLDAGKYYAVLKGKRYSMVSKITVAR